MSSLSPIRRGPYTGAGENPLKRIMLDGPNPNPETIDDYMKWVEFRFHSLSRWVTAGEPKLILETIARLEGDLQQIRYLTKKARFVEEDIDKTLKHLTREGNEG